MRSQASHDASTLPFEPLGWFAVGVLLVALFVSIRWVVRRQVISKSATTELHKDDLLRDRRAIGQGIGAASILFICFVCCLWGTHRVGNQVLKEVVNEEMTSIAVIGAHRLDLHGHEKLTEPDQLNGPEYLRVVSPLRSLLMATPHLKYIYTIRPTETGLRFVIDAADPIDSDDDGVIDQALLGEACTAQDPALVRAVETGVPAVSDAPYTDKWGTFISAFVPIKRADGTIECVVGVDADARVYLSRLHRMNRAALFGGVVAVVISVGFGVVVTLIQRRRRTAVAGLLESEERFRSIADTAPMMIWTSAADASLEYFNKPWLDFRGRTLAEEIGDGWIEGIHPDDREKMVDEYMGAFATRGTYDAEYRLKRYDGHYRWILDRGHPRFGTNGEFLGYVGACVDVTERKAAELAITRARDEAEEATRAKSEFLANMSHEIRTPMTAILGFADLLDDPSILSPEAMGQSGANAEQRDLHERVTENRHEAIVTIKRHGQNLLAIINDILDISKIEAGKMTVESVLSSPTTVIADVLSMVRMPAEERGLEVRLVFETPIPKKIHTDPTRLRQILVNLMGNSVKFTSRGRVSLHVAFDGEDAWGPTMRFRVEDTGIGIAPEKLPLLFSAFQQADNSMTRRFGGTGLGLRISQRLAALLGGGIAVESKLGQGSVFTLSIATGPVHQVQMLDVEEAQSLVGAANGVGTNRRLMAEAAAMAGSAPRVKRADGKGADRTKNGSNAEIGAQGPLAGARVLVVEDGPDNQRLIGFHLRKAGAKVEFADNGLQAVKLLTTDGTLKGALVMPRPYDLMLLDMQMPEMDGYTTARWMREREAKQDAAGHLPIIALTAHAMSDDRQRCLEAGCDEYSTKPIEKERVIALCAEAIGAQGSTASAA